MWLPGLTMERPQPTPAEIDRLGVLLTGPVLRILHGVRARINLLGEEDLRLLLRHFDCTIEDLDYRMWHACQSGKRRST